MRVAIYGRISTSNHGQDIGMQTRELREHCDRRGWQIDGRVPGRGNQRRERLPPVAQPAYGRRA